MIIDVHVHPFVKRISFLPDVPTAIERLWGAQASLERFKAVISIHHLLENFSLDDFIRTMDSAGVDKAVIVPIDLTSAYGVHLGTNEDMARFVDKYSDRLIGKRR